MINREIEFRGKCLEDGEWVFGDLRVVGEARMISILITQPKPVTEVTWMVDPKTVGQYTGLKDKNGVKIFEGDIVRHISIGRKSTYIVAWDVGSGAFHYKPTKGTGGHRMFVNGSGFAPYEIVGTTHDNPELLEVLGDE